MTRDQFILWLVEVNQQGRINYPALKFILGEVKKDPPGKKYDPDLELAAYEERKLSDMIEFDYESDNEHNVPGPSEQWHPITPKTKNQSLGVTPTYEVVIVAANCGIVTLMDMHQGPIRYIFRDGKVYELETREGITYPIPKPVGPVTKALVREQFEQAIVNHKNQV